MPERGADQDLATVTDQDLSWGDDPVESDERLARPSEAAVAATFGQAPGENQIPTFLADLFAGGKIDMSLPVYGEGRRLIEVQRYSLPSGEAVVHKAAARKTQQPYSPIAICGADQDLAPEPVQSEFGAFKEGRFDSAADSEIFIRGTGSRQARQGRVAGAAPQAGTVLAVDENVAAVNHRVEITFPLGAQTKAVGVERRIGGAVPLKAGDKADTPRIP